MVQLIKKLLENDKIRYLIGGGLTTLTNLVMFFLLRTFTAIDRNICNVIAIICAIIAAYFLNKLFVFRSHTDSISKLITEMLSFVGVRLLSMVIEVLGFSLLCDSFRMSELASKIIVQFIVVVANYVFSKLFVFKERQEGLLTKVRNNWSVVLAMAVTFVFMLIVMIVSGVAPFGQYSFTVVDSIHQYVPFMADYQDKLVNEGSIFYTWDIGLGVNFMSLLLYYMASPLNLVVMLFSRNAIPSVMSMLISVKIMISAGAFSFLLSRRRGKRQNNFLISAFGIAYALNSYMTGYYWNIMWLDCIMVLPLIILGFERMIEGESPKLYIISLFYCLYCNYYIAFIVCIFCALYFFATGHKNIRKFFIDGFKFAGASILAAGMAAFSLLTAYFAIMQTATAGSKIPKWEWYGNIFKILERHLFLTNPMRSQQFDGGANLYCGIFTVFLLFLYVLNQRIRFIEKARKLALLALLVVSFNATTLNFVWHGFHDQYGIPNRFSFVYIFVLLLIGYETLSRIKGTDFVFSIAALFFTLSFIFMCKYKGEIAGNVPEKTLITINIVLVVGYMILVILRQKDVVSPKLLSGIIAFFFAGEIITNATLGYITNGFCDRGYYMQYVDSMKEAVEYAEEYSKEQGYDMLYRSDQVNPIMLDEATMNQMKSIGTFCSTVRGNVVNTMGEMGFYTGANEYLYDGATPLTNTMLGVRYIYARDDDFYPETDSTELVKELDNVKIYENKYTLPFGYALNEDILDWDESAGTAGFCQNYFVEYATGTGDVFRRVPIEYDISGHKCDVSTSATGAILYDSDTSDKIQISASFTVPYDGEYFYNTRGNYIEKIKVFKDDEEIAYDRYQSQLAVLGKLEAGDDITIEVQFGNGYSKSGSITIDLFTFDCEALEAFYDEASKEVLNVTDSSDGYIKGDIDISEGKLLFTSVPYDEGWSVYVDGKKVETELVGGAFMAIKLSPGSHEIEMKYFPSGLKIGLIVSLVSWVIFFVVIGSTGKKKKDDTPAEEEEASCDNENVEISYENSEESQ